MALLLFWFGFLIGALVFLALEVCILLALFRRLRRRSEKSQPSESPAARDLGFGEENVASVLNKQGTVWVLEPEKVPKINVNVSPRRESKELKNKKTIVEVYPTKKYAKIIDRKLLLTGSDGSQTTIELLDCTVAAVSASDMYSRKWAKRYPIVLDSKNSVLYKGRKTCYIYFETSWEKETWCKALRVASCSDREKLNWFAQLTEEFHSYMMSLAAEYPSFLKPPATLGKTPDRTNRIDASSSKVRVFLKKIAKKATKNIAESKAGAVSSTSNGDRRIADRIRSLLDVSPTDGSVRSFSENSLNNSLQDIGQPCSPTSTKSMLQIMPDSFCNEKVANDEGTLCWNLLFTRLFFDARSSSGLHDALQARIQRTLSNMRTPSYIGKVKCTDIDLGDLPPYIHKMRVLPVDLNEAWAVEVDIEYSGGIVLDVETRIEAYEPEKENMDGISLLASADEATSEHLEGIDLSRVSSNSADQIESRNDGVKVDDLKQSRKWASNYATKWKAAVHSIANKVSQVPLSLTIRIASLRGTLRLHIKPPPSDQLWFGFTSMPEIEWNLDSSVGDQKITSAQVALLIGNRFKASIRDTLVLPNCEYICIPWMLAERDDWLPRNAAPFIWINQEPVDTTELDLTSSQPGDHKPRLDCTTDSKTDAIIPCSDDNKPGKAKNAVHIQQPAQDSKANATASQSSASSVSSTVSQSEPPLADYSSDGSKIEELKEPLFGMDENQENCSLSKAESSKDETTSGEIITFDQASKPVEEGSKPKVSRRARMMDMRKKMGEKLVEKRRLIEERSRYVVEKMRENART